MKEIQEWLGHSDFSTTANIYSHLSSETKKSTAASMMASLGLGKTSSAPEDSEPVHGNDESKTTANVKRKEEALITPLKAQRVGFEPTHRCRPKAFRVPPLGPLEYLCVLTYQKNN